MQSQGGRQRAWGLKREAESTNHPRANVDDDCEIWAVDRFPFLLIDDDHIDRCVINLDGGERIVSAGEAALNGFVLLASSLCAVPTF